MTDEELAKRDAFVREAVEIDVAQYKREGAKLGAVGALEYYRICRRQFEAKGDDGRAGWYALCEAEVLRVIASEKGTK